MSDAKRLHQQLFILVENELHPSMSQYRGVITASYGHLPAGVLSSCNSALDLLHALNNWGKICLGNYTVLKEILEDSCMISLKCKVEDQEKLIKRALYEEQLGAARQEATGRPSIPIAEDDRLYVRQGPSRHPDDETVAKQPESAFFEGDQLHELRRIPDAPGRTGDETVAKQPESGLFGSDQVCDLNLIPDDTERPRDEQRPSTVILERPRDDPRLHTAALYERPRDEQRLNSRENAYKSSHIFKIVQRSDACKDWRPLGRELGLEDPEFDVISNDYPQQLREQCYQMLQAWLQSAGRSATPKALIEALKSLDYNNVADDIIDYFIARPFDL